MVPLRGGGGPGGGGTRPGFDTALFGLWAFLGTVSMLFIGFTSAYLVRRAGADWQPLHPPALLWANTAALVASSVLLERARRRARADLPAARTSMGVAGLLGVLFVAGQVAVWQLLANRGVFLASNPHSSFFYVLTGVHAVHLLGGLAWLAACWHALGLARATARAGLTRLAVYWHFMGAVWLYLVFLLFAL